MGHFFLNDAIPPHLILFSPTPSTIISVDLIELMDPLKVYSMKVLGFLPLKPIFMPLDILKMYSEDDREFFEGTRNS